MSSFSSRGRTPGGVATGLGHGASCLPQAAGPTVHLLAGNITSQLTGFSDFSKWPAKYFFIQSLIKWENPLWGRILPYTPSLEVESKGLEPRHSTQKASSFVEQFPSGTTPWKNVALQKTPINNSQPGCLVHSLLLSWPYHSASRCNLLISVVLWWEEWFL